MCLPPWLGKTFRFTVFRLLENAFVKLPPPLPRPPLPPPLHDLIISPCVKQPHHHKFAQKSLFPYAKLFKEISPLILLRGRIYYALCSYLFPFLNVSSLSFAVQTMAFQAKLYTHCVLPKSYSVVMKFPKLF